MRLLFGFPDEKQLMGAYSKVPKGRETTDGGASPGNSATTKEAPRGRQRTKQVVIKQVRYSVAPLGLTIVLYPCPGGLHPPSVVFRTSGAFPRTPIIINIILWKLMGNYMAIIC